MEGDTILNVVGVVLVLAAVGAVAFVGALIVDPPANPHNEPAANWTLDRANATHVRIVHAGGEGVPAHALLVTVDGNRREFAASGRVTEGDDLVVPASTSANIELYWTGGRGGPVLLARWGGAAENQ